MHKQWIVGGSTHHNWFLCTKLSHLKQGHNGSRFFYYLFLYQRLGIVQRLSLLSTLIHCCQFTRTQWPRPSRMCIWFSHMNRATRARVWCYVSVHNNIELRWCSLNLDPANQTRVGLRQKLCVQSGKMQFGFN